MNQHSFVWGPDLQSQPCAFPAPCWEDFGFGLRLAGEFFIIIQEDYQ